jgi:hypothetical protein
LDIEEVPVMLPKNKKHGIGKGKRSGQGQPVKPKQL